jgi:hypothetical protein
MTIDITPERLYTGIIVFLLVMQIWQHYRLAKLEKEVKQVWTQISILITSISTKLLDLDKKVEDKVGKQTKD